MWQNNLWEITAQPNASWIWKSIMQMKEYLKIEMCYMVGNGEQISVREDPWIPSLPDYKPTPHETNPIINGVEKVAQLIYMHTGQWKRDMVRAIFDNASAESILQMKVE